MVSALFCAAEEGNIAGIKELFSMAKIDPNVANKVSTGRGDVVSNRLCAALFCSV